MDHLRSSTINCRRCGKESLVTCLVWLGIQPPTERLLSATKLLEVAAGAMSNEECVCLTGSLTVYSGEKNGGNWQTMSNFRALKVVWKAWKAKTRCLENFANAMHPLYCRCMLNLAADACELKITHVSRCQHDDAH